jgi:hypothetical protein
MPLARLFGRHPESSRAIAVLRSMDALALARVAAESWLATARAES